MEKNLMSRIRKNIEDCSYIAKADEFESNIVKTLSLNSLNRRTINILSVIDRELIS
jgi:hypothetical protein